jgi:hypothetical protein
MNVRPAVMFCWISSVDKKILRFEKKQMSQQEGPGEISGCLMVGIWFSWRRAVLRGRHIAMVQEPNVHSFFQLFHWMASIRHFRISIWKAYIIHCLSYRYKFMVHQPHTVKQSNKHDLLLRFCQRLLRSDVSVQFERLMLCLRTVHAENLFVPINNLQ